MFFDVFAKFENRKWDRINNEKRTAALSTAVPKFYLAITLESSSLKATGSSIVIPSISIA